MESLLGRNLLSPMKKAAFNNTRRTIVYVMGREGTEKSVFVAALMHDGNPKTAPRSPSTTDSLRSHSSLSTLSSLSSSSSSTSLLSSVDTVGINVHEWTPSLQIDDEGKPDASITQTDGDPPRISIEFWELSGAKHHQEVHPVYMRSPCLTLLFLEMHGDTTGNNTHLVNMLNLIQSKCPESHVMLVLSNNFKNSNTTEHQTVAETVQHIRQTVTAWLRVWEQNIKQVILELESDIENAVTKGLINETEDEKESRPSMKELVHQCTGCLRRRLEQRLRVDETVHIVDLSDGQGVSEFQKIFIEKVSNSDYFHHLDCHQNSARIKKLADTVQELKSNGTVFIPLKEFSRLDDQRPENEDLSETFCNVCQQLEASGHILLLSQSPITEAIKSKGETNPAPENNGIKTFRPSHHPQFVCVNPGVFAYMILSCIIKEDKKTFKLEANQFWPKDSGFKPPDPDLLARVLEALPHQGCIREAILPILWQEFAFDQTQIIYALKCLQCLGVLVPYEKLIQDCAGLAMPHYAMLSAQTCQMSVLMDMIPKNRPQLNWTSKPFEDDIQITWKMVNITSKCQSGIKRSLAFIKWIFESYAEYIHIWDEGVLIKFGEATICLEDVRTGVTLSCRVNAEDEESKERSVQVLWVHLATVVNALTEFISSQMPGAIFQTNLGVFGSVFFNSRTSQIQPEYSLTKCLMAWQFGGYLSYCDVMYEHQINLQLLFPFEGKSIWTPHDWIELVLLKGKNLKLWISKHTINGSRRNSQWKRRKPSKKISRRNNLSTEVKWKPEIVEDQEAVPVPADDGKPDSDSITTVSTTVPEKKESLQTTAIIPNSTHVSLTHEEWKKRATELANQFVSCTIALGVADYVALKSQSIQGVHIRKIEAQVTAARVTANAALAVHTGDVEAAARAVIEAVEAVESVTNEKSANSHGSNHQSRLCSIL